MANNIPTYSLSSFSNTTDSTKQYQAEIFDANRHFAVTYPHRHDFYEVLFIKQGSGVHIIDGNSYKIEPPCVFFMSPGQTFTAPPEVVIADGLAGNAPKDTARVRTGPGPHVLLAATEIVPPPVPGVTVMVVPFDVPVHPTGSVQI